MNVRLTKEQKTTILNSAGIYSVMQQVLLRENKLRRNQEHFWVVGLDSKSKILFIELVSLGAVNIVHVDPPDVFRMAIYKLAVSMILVHNHPSGDLTPSAADLSFTDRMLKVGKLINIEVADHLIISDKGYTSFREHGHMKKLLLSGKYEIDPQMRSMMTKIQVDHAKEEAAHEEKIGIAKKMKKEGYNDEIIMKLTGLKKKEMGMV